MRLILRTVPRKTWSLSNPQLPRPPPFHCLLKNVTSTVERARLDLMYFGCALSAHAPELEIFISLRVVFLVMSAARLRIFILFLCVCCWFLSRALSRYCSRHSGGFCMVIFGVLFRTQKSSCVSWPRGPRRSWKMTSRNVNFQLLRGQRRAVECWCDEKRKTAAHLLPTRLSATQHTYSQFKTTRHNK